VSPSSRIFTTITLDRI